MDKDHSLRENLLALTLGSALVSLGVIFFSKVGLLTGGTAGLAIFLTKVSDFSFGQIFFALNLPFYILSVMRMGWRFTVNTFIAVSIVSFAVDHLHHVIEISRIEPFYAALLGGGLIGIGMLVIFRHKMSLGGFNILALYLQERFGTSSGQNSDGARLRHRGDVTVYCGCAPYRSLRSWCHCDQLDFGDEPQTWTIPAKTANGIINT